MGRSSFLVALQAVDFKSRTFVKTGTSAISRGATFWNMPADVFKFSIELRNAESSPVPLLKSNSTTNALSAILEIIRTLTGNFYCWVSFQETFVAESVFSIVVSGWIGQLEILKRNSGAIKEYVVIPVKFQNFNLLMNAIIVSMKIVFSSKKLFCIRFNLLSESPGSKG